MGLGFRAPSTLYYAILWDHIPPFRGYKEGPGWVSGLDKVQPVAGGHRQFRLKLTLRTQRTQDPSSKECTINHSSKDPYSII